MKVIGITGGIGSGKTSLAKIIEEFGYKVIYTDNLAKKILNENQNIRNKIIETFGENSYNPDLTFNNKYISQIVFNGTDESKRKLQNLNRIVHPAVIDEMIKETERLEQNGEEIVFIESALIYEIGLEDGFDYIIVVDANEDVRAKRAADRLGITIDEVKARMRQQNSTQVEKNLADFVIENNGTIEELKDSARFIIDLIRLA
ncbi:MAG TPA: dephospho-CoA kinase [Candidatus Kapabacteria bacterium]|jgi:dephospho-CoA kinase|nr:dephospho-CoA kinase [Candidatus Kapabacteria bacterium]